MTARGTRKLTAMLAASAAATLAFSACADETTSPNGAEDLPAPAHGYQLHSPDITIPAFGEKTYCYYTHLPNDAEEGIKRFASRMTRGSHHLILFFTGVPLRDEGTVEECRAFGNMTGMSPDRIPVWAYAAQTDEAHTDMPAGVGVALRPGQPVMIQMHYLNTSNEDLHPRVTINVETFESAESYVRAGPFVSYNTQIDVPARSEGSAMGSCRVPASANFFMMSTHSHRFTTSAAVRDGDAVLVETSDWEHPGVTLWPDDAPHTFTNPRLDYRCDYMNTTDTPLVTGESALTNEMCMAIGYYYPANKWVFCLNSTAFNL